MWAETAASGRAAPASEDAKATQVNFVLHLGFNTTCEDAQTQFQTVLRFSQRYPSRVVVLCPLKLDVGVTDLRAKIYGECFLGKSKGDTRCVEFVMLSYPQSARERLEDQVSICLSTDLPLYYWAHGFSDSSKLADYTYLLTRAKRVMIDSAIAPADALTYPWPEPSALRDLVYSRLLPVRQTVGQFLARLSCGQVFCRSVRDDRLVETPAHRVWSRAAKHQVRPPAGRVRFTGHLVCIWGFEEILSLARRFRNEAGVV